MKEITPWINQEEKILIHIFVIRMKKYTITEEK